MNVLTNRDDYINSDHQLLTATISNGMMNNFNSQRLRVRCYIINPNYSKLIVPVCNDLAKNVLDLKKDNTKP